MISISSAFPVLPAQDSLYYELLALTAICGEVPCACADRLGEGYEHFYFLTNDYHGETLLWLLCHPEIIGQLNAMLLQELQPPCRNAFIENDARTDAGAPILFCYLPDLPRLFRFLSALELLQMKGAILCFDFQADALRSLCGDRVEVQTIDFAEFERRFLTSP